MKTQTDITNKADKIKGIIREEKSSIISVKFIKKDGSTRIMTFNARYKGKIKGLNASESAQKAVKTRKENNPDLINVIDLMAKKKTKKEEASRRSFFCESVLAIKSGGKTYEF